MKETLYILIRTRNPFERLHPMIATAMILWKMKNYGESKKKKISIYRRERRNQSGKKQGSVSSESAHHIM